MNNKLFTEFYKNICQSNRELIEDLSNRMIEENKLIDDYVQELQKMDDEDASVSPILKENVRKNIEIIKNNDNYYQNIITKENIEYLDNILFAEQNDKAEKDNRERFSKYTEELFCDSIELKKLMDKGLICEVRKVAEKVTKTVNNINDFLAYIPKTDETVEEYIKEMIKDGRGNRTPIKQTFSDEFYQNEIKHVKNYCETVDKLISDRKLEFEKLNKEYLKLEFDFNSVVSVYEVVNNTHFVVDHTLIRSINKLIRSSMFLKMDEDYKEQVYNIKKKCLELDERSDKVLNF